MVAIVTRARVPPTVREILEALPAWFGDPGAIDAYVADASAAEYDSYVALDAGKRVGIALVRRHFAESAELHLIAVAPEVREQGIGRALVERIVTDLRDNQCRLLSVHTVGPSHQDSAYARTRLFYEALGFLPLEEHVGLDWSGPSLIYVMPLQPK